MVEGPEGRKKDLPEVSEDEGEAVPTTNDDDDDDESSNRTAIGFRMELQTYKRS